MQVDPQFKQARKRARRRQFRRQLKQLIMFGILPAGIILAGVLAFSDIGKRLVEDKDGTFALTQVESNVVVAPVPTDNLFIDIPGDPMILRLLQDKQGNHKTTFPGPATLDISRFSSVKSDRLVLIKDNLFVQERYLVTTLPSTREDFAFFQTQRSRALTAGGQTGQILPTSDKPGLEQGNQDGSKDNLLDTINTLQEEDYTTRETENNTSVTYIRREGERTPLFEDLVIQTEVVRGFADILRSNGFSYKTAVRLTKDIATFLPVDKNLSAGAIIALRVRPEDQENRLLQMSLYAPSGYLGSVAQVGRNRIVASADPWIDKDLQSFSAVTNAGKMTSIGQYRLLDALYSAAIRNGVPTQLVGEIIVMMSKAYDLDSIARTGDQLVLLYSREHGPNGLTSGQILFIGIRGPGGDKPCYVVRDRANGGFNCYVPNARYAPADKKIKMPVAGIMTSKFGLREHPILKTVRLHTGVDWAAPKGTPVYAAADGQVSFAGDGKGYGNLLIISHSDGFETRYAHMNKFAAGMVEDITVKAGDLIGFVGTTGRSTGPHLHFEVRKDGKPVDPIPYLAGGRSAVVSNAIDQLVNQIILVESAGNATAQNMRSTATGLGQFIESTWLRMMHTYRPDLANTMNRADLLSLRSDPTLSREMVKRLAQENEAYLSARGYNPTPGQLYLAHFLGPGGAYAVLKAKDDMTIVDLMGENVVKSNPFLKNYTVANLKRWADRKMHGSSDTANRASSRALVPQTAENKLFKAVVDEMLQQNS